MKISKNILPEVKDSSDNFGYTHKSVTGKSYPINGVVGDQQAATIGQSCFAKGSAKSTYGTGAFILMNTGSKKIYSKLLHLRVSIQILYQDNHFLYLGWFEF